MTLNLYLGTLEWNKKRGLLDTLNLELENKMAEEEKEEFYTDFVRFTELEPSEYKVDALVGMIDAVCDYMFVSIGTDCKVAMNKVSLQDKLLVQALKDDMEKQIGLMNGILSQYLGNVFNFDECYEYVLDANNKKPNKQDPDGKNLKGGEWEDPKNDIKKYLLSLPGIEMYLGTVVE